MLIDWLYYIFTLSLILSWLFAIRELLFFRKIIDAFLNIDVELKNIPKVSVIVPTKDEQISIRKCLNSLAEQTYKNFECVLINDRSKDSTEAIMEEFAQKYPHFKMISINKLPEGWLGKTHAMQKGAELSSGEYLLFTDGDVIFEKEAILKAVQICVKNKLDHLCLFPKVHSKSWLLSSLNVFFGTALILFFSLLPWLRPVF